MDNLTQTRMALLRALGYGQREIESIIDKIGDIEPQYREYVLSDVEREIIVGCLRAIKYMKQIPNVTLSY